MARLRQLAIIAVACVLLGLISGCSNSDPDVPGPSNGSNLDFTSKATLTITDAGVAPGSLQVAVGDAVTVLNRGTVDHGLTSDTIDTGTLKPGESTVVFLTAAGTVMLHDRAAPDHRVELDVSEPPSST